jgi:hypothetical protein
LLTPAEALGLSGAAIASRIQLAFHRMPEPLLADLLERLRDGALERHLVYSREDGLDPVRVLPIPVTVLPEQLTYIHHVTLTLQNALKRLPGLYLADHRVAEVLRLPHAEERWFRECWGTSQREHNPVFGRLDAVVDYTSPMWKDSLRFVEPNLSGIGGIHMVPTSERLILELVGPLLRRADQALQLGLNDDIRDLLTQLLLEHADAIGTGRGVCLVEPKYDGYGIDEQVDLARYLRERHKLKVTHADPSELRLRGGRVWHGDDPVDLAYRDYAVADLLELADEGVDVEPMKVLLRENRMVSSIAADLDQKSCFEIFTDPLLAHQYFGPAEQAIFKRHVPWTRVVADRETTLPEGRPGSLLEYARTAQEQLVLKPDRGYGGEGILVGPAASPVDWESALDAALADEQRWVVQQLVAIPVREFPVLAPDGRVAMEPFYTVMGFASSEDGLAVLARASQKQVVNVAQHGGLCAVLVCHSRPEVGLVTAEHRAPSLPLR